MSKRVTLGGLFLVNRRRIGAFAFDFNGFDNLSKGLFLAFSLFLGLFLDFLRLLRLALGLSGSFLGVAFLGMAVFVAFGLVEA